MKWIVLGEVRQGYVQVLNCGFCGMLTLRMVGREDPFAPEHFSDWRGLREVLAKRLAMSRLELVGLASVAGQRDVEWRTVRALVRRRRKDTNSEL